MVGMGRARDEEAGSSGGGAGGGGWVWGVWGVGGGSVWGRLRGAGSHLDCPSGLEWSQAGQAAIVAAAARDRDCSLLLPLRRGRLLRLRASTPRAVSDSPACGRGKGGGMLASPGGAALWLRLLPLLRLLLLLHQLALLLQLIDLRHHR